MLQGAKPEIDTRILFKTEALLVAIIKHGKNTYVFDVKNVRNDHWILVKLLCKTSPKRT